MKEGICLNKKTCSELIELIKKDLLKQYDKYYVTIDEIASFLWISHACATGMMRKVPCITKNLNNKNSQKIYNINSVAEFIAQNSMIA